MTKRQIPPTVAELAQHVRELARAFKVVLIEDPTMHYQDAVSLHKLVPDGMLHAVFAKPVVDEASYAINLHELGHCCAPLGTTLERLTITQEEAAWEWARYMALDWTVTMEQVAQLAINTYYETERRQREEAQKRSAAMKRFLKKVL